MNDLDARLTVAVASFAPGGSIRGIKALEGGISATMAKFEVELSDGSPRKYVVRTPGKWTADEPPGFIEREYAILESLHRADIQSPNPVWLEPPGCEDRFYILEYIEGAPDLKPNNPASYGRQFAELHAQTHGLEMERLGLSDTRRLPTKIGNSNELAEPWDREPEIRRALNGANELEDVNAPVFRHGDLWPGNVLWLHGEVSGIVDWENASIGEPLFDLAITRLDLLWVAGWTATDAFTRHYLELNPIEASQLARFDLAAALRLSNELDLIAPSYPPLGRPDIVRETLEQDLNEFVDSALSRI